MNALFITIACVAAAFAPQSKTRANQMVQEAMPSIQECVKHRPMWKTKHDMLETGLLKMNGYERYLANPRLTLKPMRDV